MKDIVTGVVMTIFMMMMATWGLEISKKLIFGRWEAQSKSLRAFGMFGGVVILTFMTFLIGLFISADLVQIRAQHSYLPLLTQGGFLLGIYTVLMGLYLYFGPQKETTPHPAAKAGDDITLGAEIEALSPREKNQGGMLIAFIIVGVVLVVLALSGVGIK